MDYDQYCDDPLNARGQRAQPAVAPAIPPSPTVGATLTVPDDPKMLRETLCVAQAAIARATGTGDRDDEHVARLGRLIDECDRHRPLGSDGKHGSRHTATCGCDDVVPSPVVRDVITTIHELDALPVGSVVLGDDRRPWQRVQHSMDPERSWLTVSMHAYFSAASGGLLPATLLHRPDAPPATPTAGVARTCCSTHRDTCRFGGAHLWAGPFLLDGGRPVDGQVWSDPDDVQCVRCGGVCIAERAREVQR